MMAAMGRQLKQSVKVFHNFVPYRRRPEMGRFIAVAADDKLSTNAARVYVKTTPKDYDMLERGSKLYSPWKVEKQIL